MSDLKKAYEIPWFKKMVEIAMLEQDEKMIIVSNHFSWLGCQHQQIFIKEYQNVFDLYFDVDDLFAKVCEGLEQDGVLNEKFFAGKVAECCIRGMIISGAIGEMAIDKYAKRLCREEEDLVSKFKELCRTMSQRKKLMELLPKIQ